MCTCVIFSAGDAVRKKEGLAAYLLAKVDSLAVLDHDVLAAVVHHATPGASRVALLPAVGAVGGRGVLPLRARLELFAFTPAFVCAASFGCPKTSS